MPLPATIVLDPEVAVSFYRASPQASAFLQDIRLSQCQIIALEGLFFDVLDGLVEDNAWGDPLAENLAFELQRMVFNLLDELVTRGIMRFVSKDPFLPQAFVAAMSTKLGLNRCVAAIVAMEQEQPLLLNTRAQKAELEEFLQRPDELTVICLEELY